MKTDIVLLETNFVVEWDFDITTHGNGGTAPSLSYPGDPPEPCEFDIEVLALYKEHDPKEIEFPNWLKDLVTAYLYERDDVNQHVQQADQDHDYDYND